MGEGFVPSHGGSVRHAPPKTSRNLFLPSCHPVQFQHLNPIVPAEGEEAAAQSKIGQEALADFKKRF